MRPHHALLAAMTSVIWGLGFVATKFGIESFSAPQLTALRFLVASLPIFLVPRPKIGWGMLVMIGLSLFAGQFLLLFFAFEAGMPPGLASVTQQMQVFFTVGLSALFLRDLPTPVQCTGMAIAFTGLALIAFTVGGDLKYIALGLALMGALSWAIGNVLIKRLPDVPIFPLIVWASVVPPIPALLISGLQDNGPSLLVAIERASWTGICGAVYLGAVATMAYAIWGKLLQLYPAGAVAPFALLSPCTGVLASVAIFGERFNSLRFAGMSLIILGLAVILFFGRAKKAGTQIEAPLARQPAA